jgi:hypothetical protein
MAADTTINTTIDQKIDVTYTFSAASASNFLTIRNAYVEIFE